MPASRNRPKANSDKPSIVREGSRLTRGSPPKSKRDRKALKGSNEDVELEHSNLPLHAWKRPLDVAIIFLALPVTLPVMLLIAIYIKLVSPGPVFFLQTRVGQGGIRFRCIKFRSMTAKARQSVHRKHVAKAFSADTSMVKLDWVDPRIIPLGHLLRASGMDELPQLINVLRGEMSLVGPRPCATYELKRFGPDQMERFQALPGISGLWQVSGKNKTTFTEMVRLDITYIREATLGMDCQILGRTAEVVLQSVMEVVRQQPGISFPAPDQSPTRSEIKTNR